MSESVADLPHTDPSFARAELTLGWRAAIAFHRRLFRLAVHDLSNPLAAARLLAELARRGASSDNDVSALLEQLGVAAERLQGLRALLREGGSESFEVTVALDLAYSLVEREAERVGVVLNVDRAEEINVFLPRHFFLQATIALLLASIESAEDGDVMILRARCRNRQAESQDSPDELLIELESSVRRRRVCRPEELLCLEMLAGDLGGFLEITPGQNEPGARPGHDPDWRLVLPSLSMASELF